MDDSPTDESSRWGSGWGSRWVAAAV